MRWVPIALIIFMFSSSSFADCFSRYEIAVSQIRNRLVQKIYNVGKVGNLENTPQLDLLTASESIRETFALDYYRTYLLIKAAKKRTSEFHKFFQVHTA